MNRKGEMGIGKYRPGDKLCLFGCNRCVVTRGVCGPCHVMILRLIGEGRIAWAELERLGLSTPVDPKVAEHRHRIATSWVRPNRILAAVEAVREQQRRKNRHTKGSDHAAE